MIVVNLWKSYRIDTIRLIEREKKKLFPVSLILLAGFVNVPSVRKHLSHAELSFPFDVLVLHVNHQVKFLSCQVSNMLFTQTSHWSIAVYDPFTVGGFILVWKNELFLSYCNV